MITVMFLLGCLLSLFVVNRIGRRPLIIHSFVWAGIAMLFPTEIRGSAVGLVVAEPNQPEVQG